MSPRFLLFLALIIAQLAVPFYMIRREERVLAHGKVFRFRTAPFDPYDPFRGRYVALRFASEEIADPRLPGGTRKVWVELEEDRDGFAKVKGVSAIRPPGENVMRADFTPRRLTFPFNRYYMDEASAPAVEKAYRDHTKSGDAYVVVRILDGHAVLQELCIGGMPIREFLRKDSAGAFKPAPSPVTNALDH
jgi:uncharacterized membrane-anchored protein